MKSLIVIASLLLSSAAFSAEKLVCRELIGKKMTVVVETYEGLPVGKNEHLDSRQRATLSVYTTNPVIADIEVEGIAEDEDVIFDFKAANKNISFKTYMDELDQSRIVINGKVTELACF